MFITKSPVTLLLNAEVNFVFCPNVVICALADPICSTAKVGELSPPAALSGEDFAQWLGVKPEQLSAAIPTTGTKAREHASAIWCRGHGSEAD